MKLAKTLEPDIDGTDQKIKYELRAVINHHGPDPTRGHYTCFALRNDDWVFFNDEQVSVLHDGEQYYEKGEEVKY